MKKSLKIIIVIIMTIMCWVTVSYGFGVEGLKGTQTGLESLKNAGNSFIGWIRYIGMAVSVIALIAIGIKYMIGSVEEKAEYKKTLMPYFIGAILVFSASTIAQIVYLFVK